MRSNTITVLADAVMTGTSVVESQAIPLEQIFGYAMQAVWTGTPNGTLKLQASSDAPARGGTSDGTPDEIANWSDITSSSVAITGSAGNYMWNVDAAFYRWVRLVYTNTSGVGVLNVKVSVKGV